jgi:methylmalonyl-CoA/ethylmalonyl-CoA epimerase
VLVRAGDGVFIELIEPETDDSPVTALLKKGGGLHHLAFEVPDVERAVEQAEAAGCRIITPVTRGFEEREIVFVLPHFKSISRARLLTGTSRC